MASTFIVTWNPTKWSPDEAEYDSELRRSLAGKVVRSQWSTGSRRSGIGRGDRVFQLRQHDSRGIVASGEFTSSVFEDAHWDGSNRTANYAKIAWDVILPPDERLPVEVLKARIPGVSWDRLQGSGVQVANASAEALEKLWSNHLGQIKRALAVGPDEVDPSTTYSEGAVERVVINRYERDSRARHACIAHHGLDCAVCGFNFGEAYGAAGAGYIHVHHLVELSTVGKGYEVDPVKDLRPICANCHAVIHRRQPAYTIQEARNLVSR